MTMDIFNRREFLVLAASTLVAVCSSPFGAVSIAQNQHIENRLTQVSGYVIHSARVIGRTYLLQTPEERDGDRLIAGILNDHPSLKRDITTLSDKELHLKLQDCIKNDFSDDNIIELGGWVLSITEVRICALHTLI